MNNLLIQTTKEDNIRKWLKNLNYCLQEQAEKTNQLWQHFWGFGRELNSHTEVHDALFRTHMKAMEALMAIASRPV